MDKPIPESTIARMAGNIAAGLVGNGLYIDAHDRLDAIVNVAAVSVDIARAIVALIEKK